MAPDNTSHSASHTPHSIVVVFAGGGTGGHLMPGLSVAEELRRRFQPRTARSDESPERSLGGNPSPHSDGSGSSCPLRVAFVGSGSQMEKRMVEARGFEFFSRPGPKRSGSLLALAGRAAWAAGGLLAATRLIRRLRPDVVVSLGGYAAFAPSMAAALCGVPVAVMEQNALPGKANRLLSRWAREVYAPWPGTEPFFARPERVRVTGNPVRTDLLAQSAECGARSGEYGQHNSSSRTPHSALRIRPAAAARFGLDPGKKTLLVMGGSQGAQVINRAVLAVLHSLEAESSWLQVLHSAGEDGYPAVAAAYAGKKIQSAVFPFIEDMASAYALCNLALCRAGGTTLAELTALGVPAVLVPLPSAANDHQRRNASLVAGAGAALVLEQTHLDVRFRNVECRLADDFHSVFPRPAPSFAAEGNPKSPLELTAILTGLLRDEACLARMRAASLRLGCPGATADVADRILGLIRRRDVERGLRMKKTADDIPNSAIYIPQSE